MEVISGHVWRPLKNKVFCSVGRQPFKQHHNELYYQMQQIYIFEILFRLRLTFVCFQMSVKMLSKSCCFLLQQPFSQGYKHDHGLEKRRPSKPPAARGGGERMVENCFVLNHVCQLCQRMAKYSTSMNNLYQNT